MENVVGEFDFLTNCLSVLVSDFSFLAKYITTLKDQYLVVNKTIFDFIIWLCALLISEIFSQAAFVTTNLGHVEERKSR